MSAISETSFHGTHRRGGPGTNLRLAILTAIGIAVLVAIAVIVDRPQRPDGLQGIDTPVSERTYDGRGKWTGY